jgi:hypothetical protein
VTFPTSLTARTQSLDETMLLQPDTLRFSGTILPTLLALFTRCDPSLSASVVIPAARAPWTWTFLSSQTHAARGRLHPRPVLLSSGRRRASEAQRCEQSVVAFG